MQFDEMGDRSGKTLMLLPGTACNYQMNFDTVLDRLGEKYHLICVNYDGFDGSDKIFPDMITVMEKIERDPEIREFDMQHEQWLFGGDKYAVPVLKAIDEFMELDQ